MSYTGSYMRASVLEHDPGNDSHGSGKPVTLEQLHEHYWWPKQKFISWVAGPNGEDGLLLERGAPGKDYLLVEDVRSAVGNETAASVIDDGHFHVNKPRILMKNGDFQYDGRTYAPQWLEPSSDEKKVLVGVSQENVWRRSFTAIYFIFDMEKQTAEPLISSDAQAQIKLAGWSPGSVFVSFTRDNNLYIRRLTGDNEIKQITEDGGPEYFYGIPNWVYEEEIFSRNSATWWSEDGKYLAFFRTNETEVPEYFVHGKKSYPEVQQIKYPKPGAHNPVVDLQFYDVSHGDVFSVTTGDEFPDNDRIINNLIWAGDKVIVKHTNRISDHLKVMIIDVSKRQGKTINTVIHDGYKHVGYVTPLNNPEPIMLTSGEWEVDEAPSAVDLINNIVYFIATKESSIQRHVYSVKLDGSDLQPFKDISVEAYYRASFSSGAGFVLLSYRGPKILYQKIVSTPPNSISYDVVVEDNAELAGRAKNHELPVLKYGTIDLGDGIVLNYLERRPPHFNPKKKYPILFHQYSGPGSQQVTKAFGVDFQAYVASNLGYLVIAVDPRGTGFLGRKHRVSVRSQLGLLEAQDLIAAARHFASLDYVGETRVAIWGWSYGGFITLKTLEQDAGRTFTYDMAVALVTDWRYDSIYTERYMRHPQENDKGYSLSKISNATAFGQNKRFLLMHGVVDDIVHFQNSLTLLDDLNLAGVENYGVHIFADSDHDVDFHGANRIVYDKLNNWLMNAFNGMLLKVSNPKPKQITGLLDLKGC
ncbi:dipeptidyl peptidase IV N-terminal region domain-containing protein [Trichoderma sp. SZMC 28013]